MLIYLISTLTAFVLSLFTTKWLISFAKKNKLLARPRKRDVHKKAVPKLGGVAIIASFVLVAFLFFYLISPSYNFELDRSILGHYKVIGIIIASLLILITMLYDDLSGLNPWQKLLIQIVCGITAVVFGIGIDKLANPFGPELNLNEIYIPLFDLNNATIGFSLISGIITVAWIVLMMNIINFVDGVDGLASGLVMIACATIFILSTSLNQPPVALLSAILFGSVAGFLVWNFSPAKIFMGDTGSMFLGFSLGVLPLISGGKLATILLVLGFPIVDGLFVVLSRIFQGRNPLNSADKTHLHHRFLNAGFSARTAVMFMYLIAIMFAWVALRSTTVEKAVAFGVLLILLAGVIIILNKVARTKGNNG